MGGGTVLYADVSVSYRSYILTYDIEDYILGITEYERFPSPIGVIFSLIFYKKGIFKEWKEKG